MNKEELEELQQLLNMDLGNEEKKSDSAFSLGKIFKILWEKRKYYFISVPIAAVIGVALSLCVPKYYAAQVVLAPELSDASSSLGLSGIMKSLGAGRMSSAGADADAILPNLYPDLMNSNEFLLSLFNIPVESIDGSIKTTYAEYLAKYQKYPWWVYLKNYIISLLPSSDDEEVSLQNAGAKKKGKRGLNPFMLSKKQTVIMKMISNNIACEIDNKTFVISIAVQAQDPLICAVLADSTCRHLQEFIIDYRTKKARIDYEHMYEQYQAAKTEYEEAKQRVMEFNDANWDLVEEDFVVQKQALQNEMQLRFSSLSAINTQLLAARSKLDEARPVFTVLDGPSVPLLPAGPHKKKYVILMVFLVCAVQSLWFIWKAFKNKSKDTITEVNA